MIEVEIITTGDIFSGEELIGLFKRGWEFADIYKNVSTDCVEAENLPTHDRVALLNVRPNGIKVCWFEDLLVNPQNQYVVRDVIDGYLLDISSLD